jgi:membrane-bound lytic murein transglycosylase F
LATAGLVIALAFALVVVERVGAPPKRLPTPTPANALVVMVLAGPSTYFTGADGQPAGFDADLVQLFATEQGVPLKVVVANSAAQLIDGVAAGAAHLGIGGLFRPAASDPPTPGFSVAPGPGEAAPLWTAGYVDVEPVLIAATAGFRPASWRDLAGEKVAYLDATGLEPQIARVRAGHPNVRWAPLTAPNADTLIAQVNDGRLDYAIVASTEAAVSRNLYLNFDVAFAAGGRRELAWAVAPSFAKLREDLDRFIARAKRDGTLARLTERYFAHPAEVPRIDVEVFRQRIGTVLPTLRELFQEAQVASGIEWRLLAAVAYQESQWDPIATSETGARGLMQLTEETARHLGVNDRLDPRTAIIAGARYLRALRDRIPDRIAEPDRTWLALAAFNIGLGHLEDARILAQRQQLNPDAWSDVKKTLPLLAQPEYYVDAKLGYARGGMPVSFVDRVRAYYDVLLAQQQPHRPPLHAFAADDTSLR